MSRIEPTKDDRPTRPRAVRRLAVVVWFYLGAALIPAVMAGIWLLYDRRFAQWLLVLLFPLLPTLGMVCVIWLFPPVIRRKRRRYEANAFWMGLGATAVCFIMGSMQLFDQSGSLSVFMIAYFMSGAVISTVGLRFFARGDRVAYEYGKCERCGYDMRGTVLPVCPECGAGRADRCPECGVDGAGHDGPECPECGALRPIGRASPAETNSGEA